MSTFFYIDPRSCLLKGDSAVSSGARIRLSFASSFSVNGTGPAGQSQAAAVHDLRWRQPPMLLS